SNKNVQFLYSDATTFFFMDEVSYEQFELSTADMADQAGYMKEGDTVQAQFFNDRVINIELSKNVPLKVTYTEDVVKGDTTSSVLKEATVETGITIRVPAFVKTGDIISVDTSTGAYRERVK
ncbi:MAG: elongation factor P, partial [Candidatus Saccharimonadales bacterium]